MGDHVTFRASVRFDYGCNTFVGDNCYFNFNAVFLDCAPIRIGSNVMAGPGTSFFTALHPLLAEERNARIDETGRRYNLEYAKPITIEDDVWLGGGVIVQRFGDLVRGRRSTVNRIEESTVRPTLAATPGDLSLVLPKRIMDGIIEMIYALDAVAPGTANDDTLLYGVEVKFYNMEVDIDENLETKHKGLYVIGDGSGVTHSLSHASASGVYVADHIVNNQ